ncbi:MAG: glutamine synthetase beta-grasp domain-containing protein [Nanoarchaeota archaeon]
MKVIAEYLWMDGVQPTAAIRGKPKVFDVEEGTTIHTLTVPNESIKKIPIWGFDGSSTEQAEGHASDCVLKPVRVYLDPIKSKMQSEYLSIVVLCEVMVVPGNEPHPSNTRARLRALAESHKDEEFWFAIEQEYTFIQADQGGIIRPLGFPERGLPSKQGPYYCGVGADRIFGREIMERHLFACLDAQLVIAGANAEVMPGQWEFQMGNGTKASDPLRVADDLIIARYLLARIAEEYGVIASLAAKPEKEWNGAGAHTNFSTKAMRESIACFDGIIERFRRNHDVHIAVYGEGIKDRLTGHHETCSYREFRSGVSDRGASMRIPWQVAVEGKGYMEDRRPCANIDPYVVEARIMQTVMGR